MSCLRAYLFGGVRIELAGKTISRFRSQKVATLFAYLILNKARPHSRVELATLFFPENEEKRARTYLRTTLYHLKKLLCIDGKDDASFLVTTPQTIGFDANSGYWLDVAQFDELLEQASEASPEAAYRLRLEAVELYQGDLLAGYYEDWVLIEQGRLRSQLEETLRSIAEYEASHAERTKAIGHLRQLLSLKPLHEEIHRRVIELLLEEGEIEAARTQYRLCQRMLTLELGVDLDPKTAALYEKLELGRTPHFSRREAALSELRQGQYALSHGYKGTADRLLKTARRHLAEIDDPAEAEAILDLGRLALRESKPNLAHKHFNRVLRVARSNQQRDLEALALNGLGATVSALGDLEKAREYYHMALDLAEKGHYADVRWRVLNNLGRNHWLQDRYDEALRCYSVVQLLCEQLAANRGLSIVLQNQGTLYSHLGLFQDAHQCYEETLRLAEESGDLTWQRAIWVNWGDVYERQGDLKNARQCYLAGYRVSWGLEEPLGRLANLCGLGRTSCLLGDLRRSELYLSRAKRIAATIEAGSIEVEVHSAYARLHLAQENLQKAFEEISVAIELCETGLPYEEPEAIYFLRSKIQHAIGDNSSAKNSLGEARAIVERRAKHLSSEDFRFSYLNDIPLNQEIQSCSPT